MLGKKQILLFIWVPSCKAAAAGSVKAWEPTVQTVLLCRLKTRYTRDSALKTRASVADFLQTVWISVAQSVAIQCLEQIGKMKRPLCGVMNRLRVKTPGFVLWSCPVVHSSAPFLHRPVKCQENELYVTTSETHRWLHTEDAIVYSPKPNLHQKYHGHWCLGFPSPDRTLPPEACAQWTRETHPKLRCLQLALLSTRDPARHGSSHLHIVQLMSQKLNTLSSTTNLTDLSQQLMTTSRFLQQQNPERMLLRLVGLRWHSPRSPQILSQGLKQYLFVYVCGFCMSCCTCGGRRTSHLSPSKWASRDPARSWDFVASALMCWAVASPSK